MPRASLAPCLALDRQLRLPILSLANVSDSTYTCVADQNASFQQGSATNQDGRSSSLTAPNGPAQQSLVLAALQSCKGAPCNIGLIATHGTGTPLGDPIETGALGNAILKARAAECGRLALSSVKSCYGHTEGAAGGLL